MTAYAENAHIFKGGKKVVLQQRDCVAENKYVIVNWSE